MSGAGPDPRRLADVPVTDAWRAEVAALGPPARAALLARLDARLAAPPDGGPSVVAALAAVPGALDVRTADGVARWQRLFRTRGGADPVLEPALRAALDAGLPAGELAWTLEAVLAQVLDGTGRPDEAEARLRTVVRAARGSGTVVERGAFANLVWMCMNRGREAEALVLARHTLGVMRAAGDGWGEAILLDILGHLHGAADAWDDVRRCVEALDALAPRLAHEPDAARRLDGMRARHRARVAHAAGDLAGALARLDEALARAEGGRDVGVTRGLETTRVRMLLDAGRVEEAARRLAALRPAAAPGDGLEAAVLAARVAVAAAPADGARRATEAALAALGGAAPAGARLRAATELASAVRPRPELADLGARAYDAAAGAVVERLAELDAFVRETPEAAEPTVEDLRLLDTLRRRLLAEHAELARALVRLHASAAAGGPGALARIHDAGTGFVCVCAWCQRVRTRDGAWLTVQQFLPLAPRGPFEVTHGMCTTCYRQVDEAVDGRGPHAPG